MTHDIRRLHFLLPLGIFSIVVILIYLNPLLTGSMFQVNDIESQIFPWKHFLYTELVGHHSLPLWNPYVLCGTPFLGNIQANIFYPPSVLTLLSPTFGITLNIIFHHIMGGFFAYLLCRSFKISVPGAIISGLIYAFYPELFSLTISIGGIFGLQPLTWFPLILYVFKKAMDTPRIVQALRYALLTGVIIAVQILGGSPMGAFVSQGSLFGLVILSSIHLIFAKKYLIFWQRIILLASAFVSGYALSALQLLPTWELAFFSHRASGVSLDTAGIGSIDWKIFFATFIMPSSVHPGIWGLPVGVGNLIFILLTLTGVFTLWPKSLRGLSIFWALFCLSLFFSIGQHNPIFPLLYHLPGFNLFRTPQGWALLTLLCLTILIGAGVDRVFSLAKGKDPVYRVAQALFLIVSLASLASALGVFILGGDLSIAKGLFS